MPSFCAICPCPQLPVLVPRHLSLSPGACPCPRVLVLAPRCLSLPPRCLQPGAGRWERSWGCAESNKLLGKKPLKSHLQHPSHLTTQLGVPAACPLSSPQPVPSVPSPCCLPAPYQSRAALGAAGRALISSCSSFITAWPPAAWHGVPAFGVSLQPPGSSRETKIQLEGAGQRGYPRVPPGASPPKTPVLEMGALVTPGKGSPGGSLGARAIISPPSPT